MMGSHDKMFEPRSVPNTLIKCSCFLRPSFCKDLAISSVPCEIFRPLALLTP